MAINIIPKFKYFQYELEKKDFIIGIFQGLGWVMVTAYLFYDNLFFVLVLLPYIHFFLKNKEREIARKRRSRLLVEFKDTMVAISTFLAAGYSVENAFLQAYGEISNLYGKECIMSRSLDEINGKLRVNIALENAVYDMAAKLKLEDADYFATVIGYVKKSGGNLCEILRRTSSNISEKIEVANDIEVMISGKLMEQKIMNLMPYGIIGYLRLGAGEFINGLYGNVLGITLMSVCLVIYFAARYMADRIIRIEV